MVRISNNNNNDPYLGYYLNQAGSGIGVVYRGVPHQKGSGIGSYLGGLFRTVLPLLKSGARALGREALRTGVNVLRDMTSGQEPIKAVLRRRVSEAGENLHTKAKNKIKQMSGDGYTLKKTQSKHQSFSRKRAKRTRLQPAKKQKVISKDIFS